MIETDFKIIKENATLGDLVELISKCKRNIFPVVDENYSLLGIIFLDDIRDIIFKNEQYDTVLVQELMVAAPATISEKETMDEIMKKFDETNSWNLPVVNEMNRYVGFISKSRVFSSYRNSLQATTI